MFYVKTNFIFAGKVKWYGRAELMQSDHRPIMAIIDVEVHKGISLHKKCDKILNGGIFTYLI